MIVVELSFEELSEALDALDDWGGWLTREEDYRLRVEVDNATGGHVVEGRVAKAAEGCHATS